MATPLTMKINECLRVINSSEQLVRMVHDMGRVDLDDLFLSGEWREFVDGICGWFVGTLRVAVNKLYLFM